MRLKSLTIALALAVSPMFAHAEDLLQAYRDARANDPTLAQADATRLVNGEGVDQARALLLPQIDASLSLQQDNSGSGQQQVIYDDQGNPIGVGGSTGHTRSRSESIGLTQTILDFSKYADLAAAHSQADSYDAQYQAALQALIIRVSQAYFDVLTDQDALEFAKANEQAFARQLDQAQQRFQVGLSAITDVQDAKARHDSATADVISAQNTLDDAREALTQITGTPVGDLKVLREDLPMQPPKPNNQKAWVDNALAYNPNILAQRYNVDSAEHQISSARAGHLPTIDANAGYDRNAVWTQYGDAHRNTSGSSIGVTLRIPIFSGGLTQSRVRQSIYQRDAAKDSLEIDRRQVIRDTRNYFRSVIAGISEVEATRQAVISSESAVEATQAGFEVGTRTIVDVLNAQQSLTQARSDYSRARHQFILSKLLLKQASGTIDIKDLQAVNALLQSPEVAPDPTQTPAPASTPAQQQTG